MKRAIKIFLLVCAALSALLLAAAAYFFAVTAGEKLLPEKLTLSETCVRVFAADGGEIETKTSYESISEMPSWLGNAFVAVEDKRFYEHNGIDYKRVAKAAMKNIASLSFREGASTITQQLIKNTHLSGEKTLARKLKEMKLAVQLEKRCSKEEILELYLNSIYFGHSSFGIGSAARFYFGKTPALLTPAESATLAALVKSPNRYSPFKNAEKCLARRNFVLSLMQEQGYLSEEEKTLAEREELPVSPAPEEKENAYLALVYDALAERFPDVSSGDRISVYTALDRTLQAELETIEAESDVCALVRDNGTNLLKAFYSTCGEIKRLPASAIKPLAVYAPAIQENLVSPATPVLDEKTSFGDYSPSNYGGEYGGYMSVRHALSHSVNVPAVKILNELGTKKAADYLAKMNLRVGEDDLSLALALGGMKEGFTLSALADGYAVFANDGNFSPAETILRVEDGRGKILYEYAPQKTPVFSDDVCYLVNDMLQTAAKEGTARKLKSLPFPVCAKTGTGGTTKGNTDAYTIAYTKNHVVAVWLGNRDNSPVQTTGGGVPANITLKILKTLYRSGAPEKFAAPDSVREVALDKEEYEKNHALLLADPLAPSYLTTKELFRESALPARASTYFTCPTIQNPLITVKNNAVCIELCQTEYYDYVIKRRCNDEIVTVYEGKYRQYIFDNSVRQGESYVYTVTPLWQGVEGTTVSLPSVTIKKTDDVPENWWESPQTVLTEKRLLCFHRL